MNERIVQPFSVRDIHDLGLLFSVISVFWFVFEVLLLSLSSEISSLWKRKSHRANFPLSSDLCRCFWISRLAIETKCHQHASTLYQSFLESCRGCWGLADYRLLLELQNCDPARSLLRCNYDYWHATRRHLEMELVLRSFILCDSFHTIDSVDSIRISEEEEWLLASSFNLCRYDTLREVNRYTCVVISCRKTVFRILGFEYFSDVQTSKIELSSFVGSGNSIEFGDCIGNCIEFGDCIGNCVGFGNWVGNCIGFGRSVGKKNGLRRITRADSEEFTHDWSNGWQRTVFFFDCA